MINAVSHDHMRKSQSRGVGLSEEKKNYTVRYEKVRYFSKSGQLLRNNVGV